MSVKYAKIYVAKLLVPQLTLAPHQNQRFFDPFCSGNQGYMNTD